MAKIPERKSHWIYLRLWFGWVLTFFILVAIDQFDIIGKLFPAFPAWQVTHEPAWIRHTVEARSASLVVLVGGMLLATVMLYLSLRKERDDFRGRLVDSQEELAQQKYDPIRHNIECLRATKANIADFFTARQDRPFVTPEDYAEGLMRATLEAMTHGLFESPEFDKERSALQGTENDTLVLKMKRVRSMMALRRNDPGTSRPLDQLVKEFHVWLVEDLDSCIRFLEAKLPDD